MSSSWSSRRSPSARTRSSRSSWSTRRPVNRCLTPSSSPPVSTWPLTACRRWPPRSCGSRAVSRAATASRRPSGWKEGGCSRSAPRFKARPARSKASLSSRRKSETRRPRGRRRRRCDSGGGWRIHRCSRHLHSAAGSAVALVAPAAAQTSDDAVYYQDPDGRPFYSLTPKKTADGRDYRAVPASADLSFDEEPAAAPATTVAADRKIKFYRNPMGLADTSPTPKKDSMGMDYIPVYEDEDTDDGAVKLSPGKIQRTGVKSESAAPRVIRKAVRVPGTIQLDERRISVISMRSESWVQRIADVTTGTRVSKGQPLMEIYSPLISSASAESVATINSKTTGGTGPYGRGSRQRLMNLDVPDAAIVAMEKSGAIPMAIEWSAPRDGLVLERNATEGMRAQPGDVLSASR